MTRESVLDQQKRMPSLPFEIVAEPQYDDLQLVNKTGNNLTEPINIKIKLRNKEVKGNKHGVISVPKLTAHSSGKKVRLVNSDQTIMSFDFFSEADTSKTQDKKSNKNIFRIFNPGRCLRMRNDNDEDYPYLPSTLNNSDKIRSTSSIIDGQNDIIGEKLALKKNLTSISPTNTSGRIFMGKCKPGGCLDPPFGEDKYSYEPAMKRSSTSFNYVNVSDLEKETSRTNARSHIFSIEINPKAKVKNKSEIVITNANEEDNSQSLITYPSISSSKDHMRKESLDIKLKSRISSEDKARISVNEFSDIYFIPTKKERIPITEKDNKEKVVKRPDEINVENKENNNSDYNQTESSMPIVENKFLKSTLENISSIDNDINGAISNTIDESNKCVIQEEQSTTQSSKPCELRLTTAATTVSTDNINNENENFKEKHLNGENKIQDLEVTHSIESEQNADINFDKIILNTIENTEIQFKKSTSIAVKEASDSKGSLKSQHNLISDANQIKCLSNVESNLANNLISTTSKESQQFSKKSNECIQNEINKIPDSDEMQKSFVESKEMELKYDNVNQNDLPISKEVDQPLKTSLEFSNELDDKLLRNEMDISFQESSTLIEGPAYTDKMKPISISGNEIKEDEHKISPNSVPYFRGSKEQIYFSKEYTESFLIKSGDKDNSQAPLTKAEIINKDVNKSISSTNVPVQTLQHSSIGSQESIKTPTKVFYKDHDDELSKINKEIRKTSSLEHKKSYNIDINHSIASANVSNMQLKHPLIKSHESLIASEVISLKDQGDQSLLNITGHKESFESKIKEKVNASEAKSLSKTEINKTNAKQSTDSGIVPVKTLEYSSIKSQETLKTDIEVTSDKDNVDLSSLTSKERNSLIANKPTNKSTDSTTDTNYITRIDSLNKFEVKTAEVAFVSQDAETKISSSTPENIEDLKVISTHKESLIEGEKPKNRLSLTSEQIELKVEKNPKIKEANMLSDITVNKKFNKINDSKELTIDKIPKTFHYQSSDTNVRQTNKLRTSEVVTTRDEINYFQKNILGVSDRLNLKDSEHFAKQSNILLQKSIDGVPRETTNSSIAIDFGFISSVDNDNKLVIQTFDPSSPVREDMSEKISIIQSIIRVNDDEIRIPINSETDLTLQLKKPISFEGSINSRNKQEDVVEQKRVNTVKLDSLLQETLNSVYENLLPIKTIIKKLKEEAYTLSCQQNSLKEIMNAMETKPMRLTQTNPKCGCIMNKYAINEFSNFSENKK